MTPRAAIAVAVLAALLAPAAVAQPSLEPDCRNAREAAYRAQAEAERLADELGALQQARARLPYAEKAMGYSPGRLDVEIETVSAMIEMMRKPRSDRTTAEARGIRRNLIMLERYLRVLQDFRATRAMGQAIDPADNALVKWKHRIATGVPVLKAKVTGAEAAARGAQLAYDRCRSGRASAPAEGGAPYKTTVGNARLVIGATSVTGSYRVHRGARLANGPAAQAAELIHGRVRGVRNGSAVTGYWYEQGDRIVCPQPREGYPAWGRFRWTLNADGTWSGFRGNCDGEMTDTWDGSPGG